MQKDHGVDRLVGLRKGQERDDVQSGDDLVVDVDRAGRDHRGETGRDRELEREGVCACGDKSWLFGVVVGQDVEWVVKQVASVVVSV